MLITIGAFDGFHRGHAELLRLCRENASGDEWGVVTFWPHPGEYMHKLSHAMFTLKERELLRRVLNIPNMYVIEFSEGLRNLAPYEFWRLVRERFRVDGLVMGSDFHFGLNRAGNAEYLSRLAHRDGLKNIVIATLLDKPKYSSSIARARIEAGDMTGAYEILGYPFFMIGKVLHGNERGRAMNYPTANVDISGRIVPAEGVYACAVALKGELFAGAMSLGKNPTFGDVKELRCEVHILDFDGNIYGEALPVFILNKIRGMRRFSSYDELAEQIGYDVERSREIFANMDESMKTFSVNAGKIYSSHAMTLGVIRLV